MTCKRYAVRMLKGGCWSAGTVPIFLCMNTHGLVGGERVCNTSTPDMKDKLHIIDFKERPRFGKS